MKLMLSKIAEFISATTHVGTDASAVRPGDRPLDELAQGYSIDTRTIRSGELFFAVKGERLDGHDFVGAALEKGAAAAVVQKNELHRYPDKTRLLAVDDTSRAGALRFRDEDDARNYWYLARLLVTNSEVAQWSDSFAEAGVGPVN